MPTFDISTNVSASKVSDDLVKRLVDVIAKALSKPASYVVVNIKPDAKLSFGGTNDPAAIARLSSIGQIGREKNKQTSKKIMDFIEKELGILGDRFYIEFVDLDKANVGYSGTTFDDLL